MVQHTYNRGASTVTLITGDELDQAWANIEADWPKGWHQELKRYVLDTLHDCSLFIDHYEDAARQRANVSAIAQRLCGIPDDEPDQRARNAGVGA